MGLDQSLHYGPREIVQEYICLYTDLQQASNTPPEDLTDLQRAQITEMGLRLESLSNDIETHWTGRKENWVHAWFTRNHQDDDNCTPVPVSREDLQRFCILAQQSLQQHDDGISGTLLEPQAGFFFGSTEIDEYYWEDLRAERKAFKQILSQWDADDAAGTPGGAYYWAWY